MQHIPLDFLQKPEEIASALRKHEIKPDYVFFFSYVLITDESGALQWGDDRLVEKNSECRNRPTSRICGADVHGETWSLATSSRPSH